MKRSTIRIICAFLLMVLTLAGSMGMIGAAVSPAPEPSTVPTVIGSPAAADETLWVRMMMVSEVPDIRLCRTDGALLQELSTNDAKQAATDLLQPGEYLAVTAESRVTFRLNSNASITVISGEGWTDGEILYLTGSDVGTLRLQRIINSSELEGGNGWLDYVLVRSGSEHRQVLRFDTAGLHELMFYGLPYGSYSLYENGIFRARIIITKTAPDAVLELTENEVLLTNRASSDG